MLESKELTTPLTIGAALAWFICSLAVAFLADPLLNMTGTALYADLGIMRWTVTFSIFVVGLISWTSLATLFGWTMTWLCNRGVLTA